MKRRKQRMRKAHWRATRARLLSGLREAMRDFFVSVLASMGAADNAMRATLESMVQEIDDESKARNRFTA